MYPLKAQGENTHSPDIPSFYDSVGCGFYISFAILLWICNLPWWMLILCLFIAMLMPRLLESPNAKKRMQYLKTKQGVDYISYDKGWLDFENGMVRIGKSIKNAK